MPQTYTVKDNASGRTVTFSWNGAEPPTGADLEEVFASAGAQRKPARSEDFMDAPAAPAGSATKRFLSNAGEVFDPATAVEGLAHTVRHPIDTGRVILQSQGEQLRKSRQAYSEGHLSEALGHGVAGILPIVGPAAAEAGEQIATGDVAGGLGRGAGLIVASVLGGPAARRAGKVARPIAQRTAEALYQSALKPGKAVLKDVRVPRGAAPDAARRTLIQTALTERIPISPAGVKKVDALIDGLNTQVQAKLDDAAAAGKTVDPTLVEREIAAVAKDFTDQINAQPDLSAIETVRQNFRTNPKVDQPIYPVESESSALSRHLRSGGDPKSFRPPEPARAPGPIPVKTAQAMKVNTYKGLRGKYGSERGATIEAEKAGARGLKQGIEAAAPEVGPLNERVGSLIPLEQAIADAMRRRGNYDVFGLTTQVSAVGSMLHGNVYPVVLALLDRSQRVKSHAAIGLSRAGRAAGRATGRHAQRATRATMVANETGALVPAMAVETRERRPVGRARR